MVRSLRDVGRKEQPSQAPVWKSRYRRCGLGRGTWTVSALTRTLLMFARLLFLVPHLEDLRSPENIPNVVPCLIQASLNAAYLIVRRRYV